MHGTVPKANVAYWSPKLKRTVERDRETTARLEVADWTVLRFWEHEELSEVCDQIVEAVAQFR
jgi:DNA mismatch endonuclease (patch repair protein)